MPSSTKAWLHRMASLPICLDLWQVVNDLWLLQESRVLENLMEHGTRPGINKYDPPQQRYLYMYGDSAYINQPQVVFPFDSIDSTDAQQQWNVEMSCPREAVEHIYGRVTQTWPFLDDVACQKLWLSPLGCHYRTAVLLTNIMDCLRPNQVSQYFNLDLPSPEDYLAHQ
jgi:hypothetical protein